MSKPINKAEASQDTTAHILTIAARHFAEKGLAGARIDEIAADAGVNKATIYYHIGGKAELYTEVFRQNMSMGAERLFANVSKAASPEDKLVAYITTMVDNLANNPCAAPMILREMASGVEHIPEEGLQSVVGMFTTLMDILQQGQREGVFRETNPAITHLMIIGSIMFYSVGEPMREKIMASYQDDLPQLDFVTDGELAKQISDFLVQALKN